jgi:hypothetical protein
MRTAGQLWRFRTISVVIVVIFSLQTFAILARTGSKGWPFIDYPMYATSYQEGDRVVVEPRLYATFADSTEDLVTPEDLGLDRWWAFHFWVLNALSTKSSESDRNVGNFWRAKLINEDEPPSWMLGNRKTPERAVAFVVERYQERSGKQVVKLRLEDMGVLVTREGMKRVAPQESWSYILPSDARGKQ